MLDPPSDGAFGPVSLWALGQFQRRAAIKHRIACHPDCVNIVYVEGMDSDGTPNVDAPNEFNDLRLVLRVNRAGNPEIVEAWEATTEPGQ